MKACYNGYLDFICNRISYIADVQAEAEFGADEKLDLNYLHIESVMYDELDSKNTVNITDDMERAIREKLENLPVSTHYEITREWHLYENNGSELF